LASIADRVARNPQRLGLLNWIDQIWGVQIVFSGNTDQREQRMAPGIGQRRAHPMRPVGLGDRADRPVRGVKLTTPAT
jgi:hypothetical protein